MIRLAAFCLCLCAALAGQAKVKLPALIADGMVLQRGQTLHLWGTADAGEVVNVHFVADKAKLLPQDSKGKRVKAVFTATADADGRWKVNLPALRPGGPYRLQVSDRVLTDVWVGDVLLCSGQSNMELPVSRVAERFADEIDAYENPQIRQFFVPRVWNFNAPQTDLPAGAVWQGLCREHVMGFSALAYFTARELHARTGVPVGIINSCWGGTPVEAWMSEEALQPFPLYLNDKRIYEDNAYCRHIKELEGESFRRWALALYQGDPGLHDAVPWHSDRVDDSGWRTVNMFATDWGNNGLNAEAGSHWLTQQVELPAHWAGKEATLRLGCLVDADSVYVNGQFVGNTTYMYPPRIYRIPARLLRAGGNRITVRLISNGGQPSFVPEKPYKLVLNDPANHTPGKIAGEEVPLGETWHYRRGAAMPQAPSMMFFCYKPVCLYNAMIAPLTRYGVSGVVWYQGESNVSRRNEYAALLTALIADWRKAFGNDRLPFYIVELADYLHPSDTGGRKAWAEMRAEQAKVAEQNADTRLVRNADLGEWNDIHPLDKKTLGKRVADEIMKNEE